MNTFDNYSKYYNLLYRDKDYLEEIDYIDKKIKKYTLEADKIIELGCGTGIHAQFLSQKGYNVTGVDISKTMIEQARVRNPGVPFICNDIRNFSIAEKADVILALFHVMSYQTTNHALKATINNVYSHLKKDGVFLFDVWHGPAVLNIRPDVRIKRMKEDLLEITRIAEPKIDFDNNSVDVAYQVFVNNNGTYSEICETHNMRFFFRLELEILLEQFDMEIVHSEEWLSESQPSENSWGVLYVVKKKNNKEFNAK